MIEHLMEETQLKVLSWKTRKKQTLQCVNNLLKIYIYLKSLKQENKFVAGGGGSSDMILLLLILNPVLIPMPA